MDYFKLTLPGLAASRWGGRLCPGTCSGNQWLPSPFGLPEGFGSDYSDWFRTLYLFDNLVDGQVEVLIDFREDTGEILRESVVKVPEGDDEEPLYSPKAFEDAQVFAALIKLMHEHMQVLSAEASAFEDLYPIPPRIQAIGPWNPPLDGAN